MKQIIFILTIFLFWSCGQISDIKTKNESSLTEIKEQNNIIPKDIALKFINSYVEKCNKMNDSLGLFEWVVSSNLTTKSFNTELNEAYKIDPEMGFDFDPIFDAQDYPEKGFEFESYDSKTNYIIVRGIEWSDFKLTIKMSYENKIWLIDGCGIINIPNKK